MKEIERKFLLHGDKFKPVSQGTEIKQGYLSTDPERVVRVRIAGEKGFVTIKGKMIGITRDEFEYEIPKADAEKLLKLCINDIIEKRRYIEKYEMMIWEIDVFEGENRGLIIAEIELESEDQKFNLPAWVGIEVTGDKRYYNSWLSKKPYTKW